jgi:hypothetical protein
LALKDDVKKEYLLISFENIQVSSLPSVAKGLPAAMRST